MISIDMVEVQHFDKYAEDMFVSSGYRIHDDVTGSSILRDWADNVTDFIERITPDGSQLPIYKKLFIYVIENETEILDIIKNDMYNDESVSICGEFYNRGDVLSWLN